MHLPKTHWIGKQACEVHLKSGHRYGHLSDPKGRTNGLKTDGAPSVPKRSVIRKEAPLDAMEVGGVWMSRSRTWTDERSEGLWHRTLMTAAAGD